MTNGNFFLDFNKKKSNVIYKNQNNLPLLIRK